MFYNLLEISPIPHRVSGTFRFKIIHNISINFNNYRQGFFFFKLAK